MILDIWTQMGHFFSTIASGLIVGVMFDIYRTFRGVNPPSKIMTAISDILFWVLQSLIVFVFLIATNGGELRYYTLIGLLIGLIFYFKVMSKLIQVILIRIVMFISKIFSIIKNIILIPFKLILYLFSHITFGVKSMGSNIHKKSYDKKVIKNKDKVSLGKEKTKVRENKITRGFTYAKKKLSLKKEKV